MRSRYIATLVLAVCMGLTSLTAAAQDGYRQSLDRIVAVVNDDAIMQSQLDERVTQAQSRLQSQSVDLPPQEQLREQILERMIVEQIELQRAERLNLSVDDTELNQQVRAVADQNNMTVEQFADMLESQGLSLNSVREQIRHEILILKVQQAEVSSRINISEAEVNRFLQQQGAGATRDQARQAIFQQKAGDELEKWMQEIRGEAFVDNRLNEG
ncbi:SurA N-terminal domain-containing protein [Halomonas huangheensis]|uniref:SurA N-terminal domain-containing protein n=1 Tax=Halomonas huangheensis TaxID=1178482 RepID=W1N3F6_9GAMM|nr:SurA N-terminal domain-containing protein [Halomonas huangheensis]ALM51614.1 peptidylprolyl isomerase [Halomonas huangheensis]ERL50097.1 hypothetical protein BJB45_02945 [Halomonas huangheensis]